MVGDVPSVKTERRGIGINRTLLAIVQYLKDEQLPTEKAKNKVMMKDELCRKYCEEIDRILPSLEYCLAPKKSRVKSGTSSLRNQVTGARGEPPNATGVLAGFV